MKNFEKSLVSAALEGRRKEGVVGSSKTRNQIASQAGVIARAVLSSGYTNLQTANQLREKHVFAAFAELRADRSVRTLQNYTRTLRYVLAGAEKSKLRESLTNKVLGVDGSSRSGTKTAVSASVFDAAVVAARAHRDVQKGKSLSAILGLMRWGGFRIQEARMCGHAAHRHLRTLEAKGTITIRDGTKGGRLREVYICEKNRPSLRQALLDAEAVAKRNNGNIWLGRDGASAQKALGAAVSRLGLVGKNSAHSLRYAFARDQFQHYIAQGYALQGARIEVSRDLGHGDGRGTYVAQVYLK